jgi:nicotinamidase/pyrazinamidase
VKTGKDQALLVVDMLNDFLLPGAPLEVPLAKKIIPAVKRCIDRAREAGTPVIYLCDAHSEDDKEFRIWPKHAVRGTDGAKVVKELGPRPDDIIVAKSTYSAFYMTELEDILRDGGIREVMIVGILTNICVFFTAADAVMRGFDVVVPREAVASTGEKDHESALAQMEKVLKVKVT